MAKIVSEIEHESRTVKGVDVHVVELVWSDGGRSFDVVRNFDNATVTVDQSFDTMPTDEEIADLDKLCLHLRKRVEDGQFYCKTCGDWLGR